MKTPKLQLKQDKKQRVNFYASDSQKLEADIWLELKGVEPTNPPKWNDSLKWAAGKGVENQMCKLLIENGHINADYKQDEVDSLKIERYGITVSMRPDAYTIKSTLHCDEINLPQSATIELEDGEPLEIKSVNNKNSFDIQDYIDGKPRENYVMQLAFYMEALGKERGYLFVAAIDGLNTFLFTCTKLPDGRYQCENTIVDIDAEMKRFSEIWRKFQASEEPNWNEQIYKIPVNEIDWTKQTKNAIQEARMNRKVIGSAQQYKILYSSFCNLILEKQNTKRGYDENELAQIVAATAGYSSKKKELTA